MRDRLLESPVIHCDETRVQVLNEPERDPNQPILDMGASQRTRSASDPFRLHHQPGAGDAVASAG